MLPYFTEKFGNPSSNSHAFGWEARAAIDLARDSIAKLINAKSDEIIFTSGATESINLVASSFGEKFINKGDEILTTELEHHSNYIPWYFIGKKKGAIILYVSHRMNEILEISDKVTVLRDGIKVLTDKTSELSKEKIIRSMVGKDLSDNFPERTGNINEKIVIDVNNVHTKNIRNINFKIKAGEVLGIAGLSNSGQREIFKMLMGVDNIAKGKISFMDQKYEPTSPSDAWKKLISFVPRERRTEALMLKMSLKSNTTTPHYSKLSKFFFLANKQQENLITNNYSKKVQLKYNNMNQSIYQLSGGNQQKVVFSRALASNPKLLLLKRAS